MFGFEESYGCLSGTHARDKDAVVASMLFAELACFEENEGSSVYDRLQKIYKEYGYFLERAFSFGFTGIDAMDKMNKIMNDIRTSDISSVQGKKSLRSAITLRALRRNATEQRKNHFAEVQRPALHA